MAILIMKKQRCKCPCSEWLDGGNLTYGVFRDWYISNLNWLNMIHVDLGCSIFIRYCSARSAASTYNRSPHQLAEDTTLGLHWLQISWNWSCLSNLNQLKCELCKSLYIWALRSYTAIGVTVEIVSCHQRQTLSTVLGDQGIKSLVNNESAMQIHLYYLK